MLAKILEDMWVEPEVLEALTEEQKRILFLKMREEQVRRWRAREEKEEQTGQHNNTRTKKAPSKHVRWLLGPDGDVCVSVIGEVDEFRSSKLLNSINSRLRGDNLNGIQTEDLLPGRDATELGFKEDARLPLTDDEAASPSNISSEEDMDLKETDSDCESGGSVDNLSDWAPLYRPHLRNRDNQPPLTAPQPSNTDRDGPRDKQDRNTGGVVSREEKPSRCGGRVAELRKAFAADNSTPAYTKPPVPTKPLHLQRQTATCIH